MAEAGKREHFVARVEELPPGARRIVTVGRIEVGVFNVNGTYYALPNICVHQFGPLCSGKISGTLSAHPENDWKFEWGRTGEVVICPWHAMEYDLTTGQCLALPKVRLRLYPVTVRDGEIRVTI